MNFSPEPVPADGTVNVYVWTDFVCPFCLLGDGLTRQAMQGLNTRLIWMPFELRPYPVPTLRPEDDYLARTWDASVYPTAKRLGVDIRLPSVSPQPYTRTAFIGMQYAMDMGVGDEYTEAVLRAFFQRDEDVGSVKTLARIAGEVGLNPQEYLAALDSDAYARRHDAALDLARQIGIQAVPTTLVGDQLISGMTDVGRMRAAIRNARTNLLN